MCLRFLSRRAPQDFVDTLGDGSSCSWKDDEEMTISLGYKATVTSDGDMATLVPYEFDFSTYLGGIQVREDPCLNTSHTTPY